jgi:hypothetical protein
MSVSLVGLPCGSKAFETAVTMESWSDRRLASVMTGRVAVLCQRNSAMGLVLGRPIQVSMVFKTAEIPRIFRVK